MNNSSHNTPFRYLNDYFGDLEIRIETLGDIECSKIVQNLVRISTPSHFYVNSGCSSKYLNVIFSRTIISIITRLNSGIKNRNNFFAWAIFLIQKVGTNSVIYANSGDINDFVSISWEFDCEKFAKSMKMRE